MARILADGPPTRPRRTIERMSEPRGGAGRRRPVRRGRVSVIGVLGELLISAGVFVLLFLGWQLWFNDLVVGGSLRDEATRQSSTWEGNASTAEPGTQDDPPVAAAPAAGEVFGLLIVPRGINWIARKARPETLLIATVSEPLPEL